MKKSNNFDQKENPKNMKNPKDQENVASDENQETACPETGAEESVADATNEENVANATDEENTETKPEENTESEKVKELQDRYQRLLAEFDNYRKRTDKEKSSMYENGLSKALEKILPVVDNFERGLAAVPEENREDPNYVGMDQIYKQLVKTLEELGVTPMDSEGKEFDPNLHNAVMQVESDAYPENHVVTELQKGYLLHDHVLRHAMVSVSK